MPNFEGGAASPDKKPVFTGIIRKPNEQDLAAIQSILEVWVRDSRTNKLEVEEINELMETMRTSIVDQGESYQLVAEDEGKVVGVMGLRPLLDEKMKAFAVTDNPAEIVNAYVDPDNRLGRGVGMGLVKQLEKIAKDRGFKEILLNSGPRFKDTGWGFWKKVYGEPVGILKNYYDGVVDAPLWRKDLTEGGESRINLDSVFTSLNEVLGQKNREHLITEGDSTELRLKGIETAKITPNGISVLGEDFTDRVRSKEKSADTFDPEKLKRFFEGIGSSLERVNHLGISYFCDNLDDEQLRLANLAKSHGFEIYSDISSPDGKRWLFIGDKSNFNDPLFEIVLNEGKKDPKDEWHPHIQLDIDADLSIEQIEKLAQNEFGADIPNWKLYMEDVKGDVLWMGVLGETSGIKIALGVGTNLRNNKDWREKEMRSI